MNPGPRGRPDAQVGGQTMLEVRIDDATAERVAHRVVEILTEKLGVDYEHGDRWMDTSEAADFLGLTRHALDKLCAAGTVPFSQDVPLGKRYFKPSDLDEWRRRSYRDRPL